jgi:hypothetical protein
MALAISVRSARVALALTHLRKRPAFASRAGGIGSRADPSLSRSRSAAQPLLSLDFPTHQHRAEPAQLFVGPTTAGEPTSCLADLTIDDVTFY